VPYVAPLYPTDIPTYEQLGPLFDDIDFYMATPHCNRLKEMRAVMVELGLLPKGSYASVSARLDAIEQRITDLGG